MQNAIAYLVAARRCEIDELEQLNRTCELVRIASELVQNLQSERGVANIYAASGGQHFESRWQASCVSTDVARQQFFSWLASIEPNIGIAGGSRLLLRIAVALNALEGLTSIRSDVQGRTFIVAQSSNLYSQLIATLLSLIFEAADIAVDPEVSRLLVALFNLIQGKEFVGRERAAGARSFASGQLSADELRLITDAIELQEQSFERFEAFCGQSVLSQWKALQSTIPLADIERMRRQLLMPGLRADAALAEDWFNSCSVRIDQIYHVEQYLIASLQKTCAKQVELTRAELNDHQALMGALSTKEALPARSVVVSGLNERRSQDESIHLQALGSPLSRDIFEALQKQSRHLQTVSQELVAARAALEERKVVERAKGVLMSAQSITEEVAYRLLRDKAMNQNRRLVDVAESVLSMADFLPKK